MKVFVHHTAQKYLDRLPEPSKGQIKKALKNLEKEPPEGNIRPYEGNPGIWRLKATGDYRALFKYVDNIILVTHIEPRGQAYTKKTRNKRGKE
jgi:mRNA-degrading endonuclease RelE of RelBE toxin-antitoxin system